MSRINRIGTFALATLSVVVASCSGPDLSLIKVPKVDTGTLVTPNFSEFQKREEARGPVGGRDLVDANGRCPESGAQPDVAGGGQAGAAPAAAPTAQPIALKMTECEVVRAMGAPQSVQVGANGRGDRAVAMEFKTGQQAGRYHFIDGRLVSIERVGDAPVEKPPPKKPKQT
jgi:hypothetical protein